MTVPKIHRNGVMPQENLHPAALEVDRLLAQCSVRRLRRSGPGGQHRNKVETAVVVTHTPTEIKGEASERRSQEQNRRMAIFRLRINLALQLRRPPSPGSSPSQLWRSRCVGGRLAVSATHEDFPSLLAEALDTLHAHQMDIQLAAELLQCSVSQLTKFLKLEPKAMQQLNVHRSQVGLRPLR